MTCFGLEEQRQQRLLQSRPDCYRHIIELLRQEYRTCPIVHSALNILRDIEHGDLHPAPGYRRPTTKAVLVTTIAALVNDNRMLRERVTALDHENVSMAVDLMKKEIDR